MIWAGPPPEHFLKFYGAFSDLDSQDLFNADYTMIKGEFDYFMLERVGPVTNEMSFGDLLLPLEKKKTRAV